jgi:glycerate 2-kinase
VVDTTLCEDAEAISSRWLADLNLASLIEDRLGAASVLEGTVDLVAIGKASREMTAAAQNVLGPRVRRTMVISEVGPESGTSEVRVLIGEHPIPGAGSLRAGREVASFLENDGDAHSTLFLLSGGASSLCVLPASPLTLDDLSEIWRSALQAGVDITTLNQIRATTSLVAGGAMLRYVHSTQAKSLILVDNVVSGARWVASGMTYEYSPSREEAETLWSTINVGGLLRARMRSAFETRSKFMDARPGVVHENIVVGEPVMMLTSAIEEASRRGYRVVDRGARVIGDAGAVAREWGELARSADGRTVVVGVGEVAVQLEGGGEGGRCQELAWLMAKELGDSARASVFVATASDGRDYVEGVGGAWVSERTLSRIGEVGLDWSRVARTHDTNPALRALGQLIEGGHTGWNLCDLYVALVD